jgi:hypothetical protein
MAKRNGEKCGAAAISGGGSVCESGKYENMKKRNRSGVAKISA